MDFFGFIYEQMCLFRVMEIDLHTTINIEWPLSSRLYNQIFENLV